MPTSPNHDREFIESVISQSLLEDAIEWISSNLEPGDVFSVADLEAWAESNGYIVDET